MAPSNVPMKPRGGDDDRDQEGRAGAENDAAEDVAAEIVGAEKMRQRRGGVAGLQIWLR